MRIVLQRNARQEFLEAVDFYANESISASEHFIEEFEYLSRQIAEHPDRYHTTFGKYRVVLFDRYPYSIYYRVVKDTVRINAVAHQKRKPGYWLDRK